MKICVAQIRPYKGDVQKNINKQLKLAKEASQLGAELIVFPELSTTGYEPELAEQLATDVDDEIFNSIQEQANTDRITIGVGMPTKADDGINISMLIFQPNKNRLVYSKRLLHADELPYFARSDNPPFLNIKGHKIALGICYETLQREHFLNAKEHNADIFIASVAKPDRGTDKAYMHFPSVAKEFNIPILMSNSVGPSDDFISNGLSAAWNAKGQLVGQLDGENEGLLIYDTEKDGVEIIITNLN